MTFRRFCSNRFAGLAAAALATCAATAANAGEWKWSITPYAWTTDLGVDVEVADREVLDETIPFTDLLEDIDTVAQIQLEGRRGAHGVFVDLFDVNMSDDAASFALPGGQGTAVLEPEVGMTILDVAGIYDPQGDGEGIELLYGTRILDQRLEIDAEIEFATGESVVKTYETRDTLIDALVGLRFRHRFSPRWSLGLRADVSTGGTELIWSAGPTVGYSFGRDGRYQVSGGYRYMDIEFDTDEPVAASMTLGGAFLGFGVSF